jgi:Holliday junction DNA helicase RuvA
LKALRGKHLAADDPKARLQTCGQTVALHIFHHATQNNPKPSLHGFNELAERRFFELLTSVSGFGPVAAAKSMTVSVPEYASRIMTRDTRGLSQLPGIGATKAEQMIAKLRNKMALFAMMPDERVPDRPAASVEDFELKAQVALEDLGYKAREAERMIAEARRADPRAATVEALLEAVWSLERK